jgi:3-methyladenine DNA glycosylase AlkD
MKITVAEFVRKELMAKADKKTAEGSKRFFKEPVKMYGVKSKICGEITKRAKLMIKDMSKEEVFTNCEKLYQSGYGEEAWIAASLSHEKSKGFEEKDWKVLEKWVGNYIDDWAKCDTLCNHTIGSFIDKYPKYIDELKQWTQSPNRWVRRASAVSLIVPAREGRYLKEIFEIADSLLLDNDDMVQKGYGWMLKVACQNHEKEVFDYVMAHKKNMPRTALRYAIEKMPVELKKKTMEK